MKTHKKKKVEIILEQPLLERALSAIDELGATGYTVVSAQAGRGSMGRWQSGDLSSAFGRVMIVVIAEADIAERIVERAFDLLHEYTAIVYVSDVEVVRGERF